MFPKKAWKKFVGGPFAKVPYHPPPPLPLRTLATFNPGPTHSAAPLPAPRARGAHDTRACRTGCLQGLAACRDRQEAPSIPIHTRREAPTTPAPAGLAGRTGSLQGRAACHDWLPAGTVGAQGARRHPWRARGARAGRRSVADALADLAQWRGLEKRSGRGAAALLARTGTRATRAA